VGRDHVRGSTQRDVRRSRIPRRWSGVRMFVLHDPTRFHPRSIPIQCRCADGFGEGAHRSREVRRLVDGGTTACGQIVARSLNWHPDGAPFGLAGYWVRFPEDKRPQHGDSGAPVWNRLTGASLGLVSASRPDDLSETLVAPLLHPPNMPNNRVPGILHQQNLQSLQLRLGG
jgi:hypothetical protein